MANSIPFFTQAAILDQFVKSDNPGADEATASIITEMLRDRKDLREYFFRNRPHIAWVPLLWDKGFFRVPPQPVVTDEGTMMSFWEAQDYLISVASDVPEYFLRHLDALGPHPFYASRAVRVLSQLRTDEMEQAVPQILAWLADYTAGRQVATEAYHLVAPLRDERPDAALRLLGGLVRPFANPRAQELNKHVFGAEAVSLLDDYQFSLPEFQGTLSIFAQSNSAGLIDLLEKSLSLGLRIEADRKGQETPSSWWRSAVEPSAQNFHHHYKDDLLDWLRDACERFVAESGEAARPLVERYLEPTGDVPDVLRRLGLHLVRVNVSVFRDLMERELLVSASYDDTGVHHEFFNLLRDGFPLLDPRVRKEVLTLIFAGPSSERLDAVRAWGREREVTDDDEYCRSYIRHWVLTRLWMVGDELDGAEREELMRLTAEFGEPEHPDFTHWSTSVREVSQVSPVTPDDLAAQEPSQLLEYIKTWQSPSDAAHGFEHVSREGLGSALAGLIIQNAPKFRPVLVEALSVHPEYAHAFLMRVGRRGDSDGPLPLAPEILVEICEGILRRPDVRSDMRRVSMVGWRDVRLRVVEALEAVLASDAGLVRSLLPRICDAFILLLDDPDPTPQDDRPNEGWVGHGDPSTVALNHVRPAALIGLIEYARRAVEAGDEEKGSASGRLEEVVRNSLTAKLSDPSLAVHSVYGRFLMLLNWLDPSWVASHLGDIFPEGEGEERRWAYVAAWDAYVIFNRSLYPPLFKKLRPHYERAIANLHDGYVTRTHLQPVEGLAVHLTFDHFQEVQEGVSPAETLLYSFFAQAEGEHLRQAAWILWRNCKTFAENGRAVEEWWPAVRRIWQSQVERAASQNFPSDFDQEMAWFAELLDLAPPDETLESLWPLLQGMLPYVSTNGHRHRAWEAIERFVACQVESDPVRSIELYTKMYERASGPNWVHGEDLPRKIISYGVSDTASRAQTLRLIDLLGRRGDLRYRDIYDRYAS